MDEERYPGERRVLSLFLRELRPVVEQRLGSRSLLHHAIRRALLGGGLTALRHARGIFNQLPRATKAELSAGLVARSAASRPLAGTRHVTPAR